MAAKAYCLAIVFSLIILSLLLPVFPATFTFVNQCGHTVWPGLLSNAGTAQLPTTGFALNSGDSFPVSVPASWSGRMWGRSLCSQDAATGRFSCLTGDCGSGDVECAGGGAAPPATLAEFTLNGAGGLDFYDVSLVDGYNLPVLVAPQGGAGGNCTITGCAADLNAGCPSELKVVSADGGGGVACRSACEAFGEARYCCSGEYATPDTCRPSAYSEAFKSACPRAYSYAYDDGTSTFTCAAAGYVITFCPPPSTSEKASESSSSSGGGGGGSALLVSNGGELRLKGVDLCGILVVFILASVLQLWRFDCTRPEPEYVPWDPLEVEIFGRVKPALPESGSSNPRPVFFDDARRREIFLRNDEGRGHDAAGVKRI